MNKIYTPEEIFRYRIEKWIRDNNTTVKGFANRIGRKPATVKRWLCEFRIPHETVLPTIAEVLGMVAEDLTQPLTDDEIKDLKGDGNA